MAIFENVKTPYCINASIEVASNNLHKTTRSEDIRLQRKSVASVFNLMKGNKRKWWTLLPPVA